jgi:hypothetical protein
MKSGLLPYLSELLESLYDSFINQHHGGYIVACPYGQREQFIFGEKRASLHFLMTPLPELQSLIA